LVTAASQLDNGGESDSIKAVEDAKMAIQMLYSQSKLTMMRRENRKIRHENEILKA
jgi:hypothetical protein